MFDLESVLKHYHWTTRIVPNELQYFSYETIFSKDHIIISFPIFLFLFRFFWFQLLCRVTGSQLSCREGIYWKKPHVAPLLSQGYCQKREQSPYLVGATGKTWNGRHLLLSENLDLVVNLELWHWSGVNGIKVKVDCFVMTLTMWI